VLIGSIVFLYVHFNKTGHIMVWQCPAVCFKTIYLSRPQLKRLKIISWNLTDTCIITRWCVPYHL